MFWGLLIVLGIILLIYAVMRKKLAHTKNNDSSSIKIKEIRHLMPKKSLCLVEVGGEEFLLGLGTDTISLLSPVTSRKNKRFDETLASIDEQHTNANS